jgi:hypothetical protein
MIETQPQTPAMMIERQRKGGAKNKENSQQGLLIKIREQQTKKVDHQDQNFRRYDVGHDRADKKAFLTFEDDSACIATGPEIERFCKDRRAATGGAIKFETPTEGEQDRARISFHYFLRRATRTLPLLDWATLESDFTWLDLGSWLWQVGFV